MRILSSGLLLGLIVSFCLTLLGCGGMNSSDPLSFETDSIFRRGEQLQVEMSYPVARGAGAVADSINRTISQALNGNMLGEDLPWQTLSVVRAIDTLVALKNQDTILQRMPYQLMSSGSVYERAGLVSIYLQQYVYQGGAHGNSPVQFLNFDRNTGARLTLTELCTDTTALSRLNKTAFSAFMAAKPDKEAAMYLFVTPDALPLPGNVGFDSTGMVMLYNQYEIAAYVFGISRYTIPYADLDPILTPIAQTK